MSAKITMRKKKARKVKRHALTLHLFEVITWFTDLSVYTMCFLILESKLSANYHNTNKCPIPMFVSIFISAEDRGL